MQLNKYMINNHIKKGQVWKSKTHKNMGYWRKIENLSSKSQNKSLDVILCWVFFENLNITEFVDTTKTNKW